jgi:hypothetical protein
MGGAYQLLARIFCTVVNISFSMMTGFDGLPSNGLPITRAALIDREHIRAETSFQNRRDLGAAQAASGAWACWAGLVIVFTTLMYSCYSQSIILK